MGSMTETEAVKDNETWIRSLARRYAGAGGGALFDDLVQEGFISLIKASRCWRPEGGASLRTLASKPVRTTMRRRVTRARSAGLICRSGPTRAGKVYPTSLDAPLISANNEHTLHDVLKSDRSSPEDDLLSAERAAIVRRAMSTLPSRDAEIVNDAMSGIEYRTIGERFGLTKQRVDQVVLKWLPILRKRIEKELSRVDR